MSEEFPENDKQDLPLTTSPDHPWRTSDPDIHPESFCHRCRGRNISWFAPNDLWLEVMRENDINGKWLWNEIICPICFIELTEQKLGRVFCEVRFSTVAEYKKTGIVPFQENRGE